MERLIEFHHKLLQNTSLKFIRSLGSQIKWNSRMIGIKGARGTGKTTLMLQHIKENFSDKDEALYISLDNLWFADHKIIELADKFTKNGGTHLFIDEVHKYPNWSIELKNIYDNYPELNIVFTGSSLLEILNSRADLSRRALIYYMQGLSYREFLSIESNVKFQSYTLEEILKNHLELSHYILNETKPLKHFSKYLKSGYYPFYKDVEDMYHNQVENIINMIIEIELPLLRGVDIAYSNKIKQLIKIIAQSAPFIPNVSKLSQKININRHTLLAYIHYLQEAGLTKNLYKDANGISLLQKPEKIFLENSNLAYAISPENVNIGNVRETFTYNQLGYHHKVTFPDDADFLVNGKYLLEVGGSNKKGNTQLKKENFYVFSDDIEFGHKNKIPLWLLGFLY